MIELFFTDSIKWELKNRLLDQMNLIEDIQYEIDDGSMESIKGATFKMKRVLSRFIEEVDNAQTIG